MTPSVTDKYCVGSNVRLTHGFEFFRSGRSTLQHIAETDLVRRSAFHCVFGVNNLMAYLRGQFFKMKRTKVKKERVRGSTVSQFNDHNLNGSYHRLLPYESLLVPLG